MNYKQTRGHRNNNPLNIRRTKDKWQGLSSVQNDKDFCTFDSLEYGFRAAFRIIHNGFKAKPPRNNVRSIISRWAPPNENDTRRYMNFVCSLIGIPSAVPLNYSDKSIMVFMVRAMAYMETGNWYPFDVIEKGYELEKV